MKPLFWLFAVLLVLLMLVSSFVGLQVVFNGQPTAWGTCK